MASQDVREVIPRVRRALEGAPLPTDDPGRLSDDALLPLAADAIADLILLTAGRWAKTLGVAGFDDTQTPPVPDEWTVDPELSLPEQSLVAFQAALTFYFHTFKDQKVSERIRNEGQEWEWQLSANAVRDQFALLKAQRDDALKALQELNPVFARVESILAVRDRLAAVRLEPWVYGGLGGGQEQAVIWNPVP